MATLKQLTTFIAVAEYKKMSEAAKKLFISQPTVSQIISDLEKEYQVQLFKRMPRELKITPAGQLLLNSAQEIVSIHQNLKQSMKNINSVRPLRIGATLTIGNTLMSSLAVDLGKQCPDIDLSVFVDNTRMIEHRLIHNELDIALVEGLIVREEIHTEPIIEDVLQIICGNIHPFAAYDTIEIEKLRSQNFILREKGSGTRALFEQMMQTHCISYQTKWECNSSTAILDAVSHNLGLGVLSKRCIQKNSEQGLLHALSIRGIPMKRFFYICYKKNHPITSQMQDFIQIVENQNEKYS